MSLVLFARNILSSICNHSFSITRRFFFSPLSQDLSPTFGPPSNKLFVAGQSSIVDEKMLKNVFSALGDVTKVRIMYDKDTGGGRLEDLGSSIFSKKMAQSLPEMP